MGLFRSRAKKKLLKAEAKLVNQQLTERKQEIQRERAGDSILMQPTLGDAVGKWRQRRAEKD